MGQAFDIVEKLLMTTYTIVLPVLLARLVESRKEKKASRQFMTESVNAITATVNNLVEKIDMNEAMTSRYRIIRAADEIRNGEELSDEHLEQLGEDIEIYKNYCENINPNYKNHKGQKSMKLVLEYEQKKEGRALT